MSLADYFHSVATGPKRRRERLTPLGFLFFGSTLVVVVVGGRHTDGWLRLPPLLPGAIGTVLGAVFLTAGIWLCGWCVARFLRARGTPVPLNPPDALIVSGPYALVRNPMLTGVFGALLGLGLLLHSIGVVLIWTPAYALVHLIELKCVEEPELARRFGPSYEKYRAQVPMFIPRLRRHHPMRSIVVLFCAAIPAVAAEGASNARSAGDSGAVAKPFNLVGQVPLPPGDGSRGVEVVATVQTAGREPHDI